MTTFGTPRRHVAVCTSTNDLAREWASDPDAPAPHGALVTAEFQTRGRGRRGRHWEAATADSALMSFVLRPDLAPPQRWQLGFVASLAVADALERLGLDARLKWPNDVLLDGRKAAGVLVEAVSDFAIAGIGINVRQTAFDGHDYAYPPTSLHHCTGTAWAVEEVTRMVALAYQDWDSTFQDEGFAPIFSAWQARLAIGAVLRRGDAEGTLAGLMLDGSAQVRLPDGTFTNWATVEP